MYEQQHERAIYEKAFSQALAFAVEGLGAERAIVCFSGNGRVHGLDAEKLWTSEPISLTLLRQLVDEAAPTVLVAQTQPEYSNRTSIVLTGISGVLFAPILARTGEVCGFCYLDRRVRAGAFQNHDLKQLQAVISGSLEPTLRETGAIRPLSWDVLMKTSWI